MAAEHVSSKLRLTCNSIFLFIIAATAAGTDLNIIKTLPGYSGTLPFKLETGYISLGENGERQLFYYFVESERDPNTDPLLFWFIGGPGCSGLSPLVYEIGPLSFDFSTFNGSLPDLILNPYSWTKIASIIFIDAPVGAGFSYVNSSQVYTSSDTKSTWDNYMFLRKGYLSGNSPADGDKHLNERIPYVHRMALISDEYYELAKSSCNGEYLNPDPNNYKCLNVLQLIKECIDNINEKHILIPNCKLSPPKADDFTERRMIIEHDPIDFLLMSKQEADPWCLLNNHVTSYVWANDPSVQEALHVRKGTIKGYWKRCNKSLLYEYDVENALPYHRLLLDKGYEALVYSGDHDMGVPYTFTIKWIRSLNLTIEDEWRPWTLDGQVAGYVEKYKKNDRAFLTFATVKGAGHTAPEYMPEQCFAMVKRWFSLFPL